jgi:sodium/hydrogen exchanger family protein/TrkA family protein
MGVYAVSNVVMHEAGLVAATVLGVTLANLRVPGIGELRRFKEALVVLIVSALFVTLSADLDRGVLARLSWPLLGLTAAMLFVIRPVAIGLATARSGLSLQERVLAAWIAPRGIVAAAIAGVAGLRLQSAGYADAALVMPAVFALIAATMILHGFSLGPLAARLRLRLEEAPGLVLVGASAWTTDLAMTLHEQGVPVLLVDTFPGALDPARALGLPVLQAELLSEHGEQELQGRPADWLLAATPDDIYNGLLCARLGPELGRERVYQLGPVGGLDQGRWVSRDWRGKVLGAPPVDATRMAAQYEAGWRFAALTLEEDKMPENSVPILLIRRGGAMTLVSAEDAVPPHPAPGDIAVVLAQPVQSGETARRQEDRAGHESAYEHVSLV